MFSNLLLSAVLFGSSVLGATSPLSSTINQQCFTQYSIVKPRVLTTTDFDTKTTKTATKMIYITPRFTVTPNAVTSTVTTTHTNTGTVTAPTTTDTYTTSKTVTQTNTEVDTSSFTQMVTTSTIVTISSTTTVAAPAGFTGLAKWPGYFPKRDVAARRDASASNTAAASTNFLLPTIAPVAHQLHARSPAAGRVAQYPYAVQCTRSITYFSTKTSTVTVPTSTTTLNVQTLWNTVTEPATKTVTVIPADETSLVTIMSSVTTTSTTIVSTTSTLTNTNTIFAPSATFLAQCDPATNAISSAVGQKIGTVSYNPAFVLQSLYTQDRTGYGCCVQCANTANCAGYAQAPQSVGGACFYLVSDGRCNSQQSFGDAFRYYNTNGNGYTVGNGQCGFLSPIAGPPQ